MLNSGEGHRGWQVEQSPREGPWKLSQRPRALGRCESSLGALPEGLFYLPPPSTCTSVYTTLERPSECSYPICHPPKVFGTSVLLRPRWLPEPRPAPHSDHRTVSRFTKGAVKLPWWLHCGGGGRQWLSSRTDNSASLARYVKQILGQAAMLCGKYCPWEVSKDTQSFPRVYTISNYLPPFPTIST